MLFLNYHFFQYVLIRFIFLAAHKEGKNWHTFFFLVVSLKLYSAIPLSHLKAAVTTIKLVPYSGAPFLTFESHNTRHLRSEYF